MPFMIGEAPIRRTMQYLKNCKIIFRENVRIFSISYLHREEHSLGAREFVFWNFPQIQFNNPTVQCIKFRNLAPTPFIKVYLEDEEPVLIDLDCRTREEILTHLENLHIITKTKEELELEKKTVEEKTHPSFFGSGCDRHCICEVSGQIPCPNLVMLPRKWRGLPPKEPKVIIPPCIEKWGKDLTASVTGDLKTYKISTEENFEIL